MVPRARRGGRSGHRVELTATSERATIAGHGAREYGLTGDDVRGSMWITEDIDPIAMLGPDAATWWREVGAASVAGPLAEFVRAISRSGAKGMPLWIVASVKMADGPLDVSSKVTTAEKKPPPRGVANVPAGYRKESYPLERLVSPPG